MATEKLKKLPPMKEKTRPYLDTLEPEKPAKNLSGGGSLVEPKGRTVKVTASAPNEETTDTPSGPMEDHNPGNPWPKKPFAVSKSYDVYGSQSGDATSGVISSQPEGRKSLPPASAVEDAKEVKGAAVRCAKQQTGENRYPINSHVETKKEFGPNN
jgi:hypothetical protein